MGRELKMPDTCLIFVGSSTVSSPQITVCFLEHYLGSSYSEKMEGRENHLMMEKLIVHGIFVRILGGNGTINQKGM